MNKNSALSIAFMAIMTILLLNACKPTDKKIEPNTGGNESISETADTTKDNVVYDKSFTTRNGERVMQMEVKVNGTIDDVWRMFTTSSELQTFMAPVIDVDFKMGGKWEASYDPAAKLGSTENIINEIILYVPYEMYAIKCVRPPTGFANDEVIKSMYSTMQFEKSGNNKVKIVFKGFGWKNKEEFNKLWEPSLMANRCVLEWFVMRQQKGPLNWAEALRKM